MATDAPIRYSAAQATASLALVRPIVRDVRTAYLRLQKHLAGLDQKGLLAAAAESNDLPEGARDELQRFGELLAELAELGIRLEDPELGRIAFHGEHDGEDVTLCWKLGEPEVRYWYPEDGDYGQRRPV